MRIVLTEKCKSLKGTLGRGFGYAIVKRKNGFFSQRCNHKVDVPPDGHWRFIVQCAELAQIGLHIKDIKVEREELRQALDEARHYIAAQSVKMPFYNARDIINLKTTFGL